MTDLFDEIEGLQTEQQSQLVRASGGDLFDELESVGQPAPQQPSRQIQQPTVLPVPARQQGPARRGQGRARAQVRQDQQDVVRRLTDEFEAGRLTSADLTPQQIESIQKERVRRVPELGGGRGLSGFTGGEAGLGTALLGVTTLDPVEFGLILSQQVPDVGIVTTPEGDQLAVNNKTGEVVNLNRQGLSNIDVIQALGLASLFTPGSTAAGSAARGAATLTGRQVASPLALSAVSQGIAAAGTEAGVQAAQGLAGGEFNAEDVALAGGLGVAADVALPVAREAGRRVVGAVVEPIETAQQQARRDLFRQQGIAPTRAQVTREATEFQAQQELAKRSGPVRARLDQQEARLQGAFEKQAVDTQGDIVTSTATPIDEVLSRSIDLDRTIGELYQAARDIAPGAKDIRLNRLSERLRSISGEERVSGGLVSSVRNNLRERGIIDAKGRIQGRVSVETSEQVRKDINGLFDSISDRGRQLSRSLKESLDDDVFAARGEDLFEQARSAKADFERGLSRAKISKFDSRKQNLVRDMLDNKISPDNFTQDVVIAKKWRAEDMSQLKNYLSQTESGRQAWNDLRAQTVDLIQKRAFTGPVRADNVSKSLSRSGLDSALDRIGSSKMMVIFDKQEREFFKKMKEVAKLREPPPATFQGLGPSAQAFDEAKRRFPVVGGLIGLLSDFKKQRLLLKLPRQAPKRQTPKRTSRGSRVKRLPGVQASRTLEEDK